MASFYEELRNQVLSGGISRKDWADFVRSIRTESHALKCWIGCRVGGRLVLKAWRRELRVSSGRVLSISRPIIARLSAGSSGQSHLTWLPCCKSSESKFEAPVANITKATELATARRVIELVRYYFDDEQGLPSEQDVAVMEKLFQEVHHAQQLKTLGLFNRPLGKRSSVPENCQSTGVPYPARFDLVWAAQEADVLRFKNPDELRDSLGLVHFYAGDKIVVFRYVLPDQVTAMVPTVIEAFGGWAFWPAGPDAEQRAVNYRTGQRGPCEFVHSAAVEPTTMQFRWVGEIGTNWDS